MGPLKNKQQLFFDLDDTLWDFEANSTLVLTELFSEHDLVNKLKVNCDEFLKHYYRINLELWTKLYRREIDKEYLRNERFREVFRFFNYESNVEHLQISNFYLQRAPHGKALKPSCISTLDYLQEKYDLHIITNGFAETQSIKLDGCGLRPYFKNIIISEEHGFVKPEEGIFRLAENLAGAQSDNCVMIGDNLESDIKGALNAGWRAIHLNTTVVTPVHGSTISDLRELQELF